MDYETKATPTYKQATCYIVQKVYKQYAEFWDLARNCGNSPNFWLLCGQFQVTLVILSLSLCGHFVSL